MSFCSTCCGVNKQAAVRSKCITTHRQSCISWISSQACEDAASREQSDSPGSGRSQQLHTNQTQLLKPLLMSAAVDKSLTERHHLCPLKALRQLKPGIDLHLLLVGMWLLQTDICADKHSVHLILKY